MAVDEKVAALSKPYEEIEQAIIDFLNTDKGKELQKTFGVTNQTSEKDKKAFLAGLMLEVLKAM